MRQDEISLSSRALIELIRSTLSKGASFRFQVKGSSMSPFIKDSDIVIISPINNYPIGFGKPVAFVKPTQEKLIIHRIIDKNRCGFILKGDCANETDGLVPKANILGIVTSVERDSKLIKFGLGPERVVIALLSRLSLLPFCFWVWMLIPLSMRRFIKCRIIS